MANAVNSNPIWIDDVSSPVTITEKHIRLIQWVDDNADVAHDDIFNFTINGTTCNIKYQMEANIALPVVYQAGPFYPPLKVTSATFTTMTHGAAIVWLA